MRAREQMAGARFRMGGDWTPAGTFAPDMCRESAGNGVSYCGSSRTGEMGRIGKVAIMAVAALLVATAADAQSRRKREREPPPPSAPAPDKRDRLVTAPGTPFNGRPYWQALAQCGGIYFRLNTLYSTAAIQAKVVKPDPAANAAFTKKSDAARRTATAFFEAAERFLVADRGLAREGAIMTYDAQATAEGDRHKTIDAGEQAARPCPALYQTCRDASPKICNEATVAAADWR
jgi:hypothetical protein